MNEEKTRTAPAQDATTATAAPVITLTEPIKRGAQVIDKVELRKPRAGELRGLNLVELMAFRYEAMAQLLPRISTPTLLPAEIAALDPADLVSLGVGVAGFFVPKEKMDELQSPSA